VAIAKRVSSKIDADIGTSLCEPCCHKQDGTVLKSAQKVEQQSVGA